MLLVVEFAQVFAGGGDLIDDDVYHTPRNYTYQVTRIRTEVPPADQAAVFYRWEGSTLPSSMWVCVVRYRTGSTFGTTRGLGCFEGAFLTKEEAETRRRAIYESNTSIHGTPPWQDGYFDDIEDIEVYQVPVT